MIAKNQKLDEALKLFAPQHNGVVLSKSYKDIQHLIQAGESKLNPNEVGRILDKLISDGHITLDKVRMYQERVPNAPNEIMFQYYFLTFNGEYFIINGGYKKSYERDLHEKRIKNRNDVLLTIGTWLAGVGSTLLVLWEIYKHYFLHID